MSKMAVSRSWADRVTNVWGQKKKEKFTSLSGGRNHPKLTCSAPEFILEHTSWRFFHKNEHIGSYDLPIQGDNSNYMTMDMSLT